MRVWAVVYNPETFPDELYQRALLAVDHDSVVKIKKFHRREDACRCLIGRFLRNMILYERGVDPSTASFALTEPGKPYIAYPILDPPIAYNVAHDNTLVAIAYSSNTHNPPAHNVGVDVMRVRLPGRAPFSTFIASMGEVLTPLEYQQVTAGKSDSENLRRFFWSWTVKEAYTKAVGFGLGFDFRRVEFDAIANVVRVDGTRLTGWRFVKFITYIDGDDYQGVTAEYVGGDHLEIIPETTELPNYLKKCDAVPFIQGALQLLVHSLER